MERKIRFGNNENYDNNKVDLIYETEKAIGNLRKLGINMEEYVNPENVLIGLGTSQQEFYNLYNRLSNLFEEIEKNNPKIKEQFDILEKKQQELMNMHTNPETKLKDLHNKGAEMFKILNNMLEDYIKENTSQQNLENVFSQKPPVRSTPIQEKEQTIFRKR